MEPELSKMDVLLNTRNPEVLQRGCLSEKSYFGAYCTPGLAQHCSVNNVL